MAGDDVVKARKKWKETEKKSAAPVVVKRKAQALDTWRQKTKKFRRLRPKKEGGKICPPERSGSWPTRPWLHHVCCGMFRFISHICKYCLIFVEFVQSYMRAWSYGKGHFDRQRISMHMFVYVGLNCLSSMHCPANTDPHVVYSCPIPSMWSTPGCGALDAPPPFWQLALFNLIQSTSTVAVICTTSANFLELHHASRPSASTEAVAGSAHRVLRLCHRPSDAKRRARSLISHRIGSCASLSSITRPSSRRHPLRSVELSICSTRCDSCTRR